jgi:hypothetical protein
MTETTDRLPNAFWIGLDLAQANDWTALAVSERIGTSPNRYHTRHLDRWHPYRYGDVITQVAGIIAKLRTIVHVWDGDRYHAERSPVTLVIDRTGVGRAVGDLFLDARLDCSVELVTITGGDIVGRDGPADRTPKRDLAGVIAVLLQTGRLEIAAGLAHAPTLKAELKNFRVTINRRGHDAYGAGEDWREGQHDDLVLAQALALWHAETYGAGGFEDVPDDILAQLREFGIG